MLLFHDVDADAGTAGSHAAPAHASRAAAAAASKTAAKKKTPGKKGLPKHRGKDEEDAGGRQTCPFQVRYFCTIFHTWICAHRDPRFASSTKLVLRMRVLQ